MKTHATILLLATISVQASAQVFNRTMTHDGLQREYAIYVPPSYTGDEAWPLVVSMPEPSALLIVLVTLTVVWLFGRSIPFLHLALVANN